MEYLKNLLEKKNMNQLVLTIILIIYLVMGSQLPCPLSSLVDTPVGKVVIALSALILFAYANPILGVIGLLVAFEMIRNASKNKYYNNYGFSTEFNPSLDPYYPTEQKKWSPFTPQHQFPYTLEQEMVKKMTPKRNKNYTKEKYSYKPILDDTYDAAPVNYN
jgi:hypothetical protein